MNEVQERDRFYDWWREQPAFQKFDHIGCLDNDGRWHYDRSEVQDAWRAWRAAVSAPSFT